MRNTKSKKVTAKKQAKTKPKGGKEKVVTVLPEQTDRAEIEKIVSELSIEQKTRLLSILHEREKQPEQAEVKDTIDISRIAEGIEAEPYSGVAMAYALLQMVGPGQNPELHRQISKKLYSTLDGIAEGIEPQGTDLEADIAPVRKWFAMLSGFKIGTLLVRHNTDNPPEKNTDEATKEKNYFYFVEKWRKGMSYREKLAIVLSWQLTNKEHIYKREQLYDGNIGNDIFHECEEAVVGAMSDPEYLKTADRTEVALTAFVAGLLPMEV